MLISTVCAVVSIMPSGCGKLNSSASVARMGSYLFMNLRAHATGTASLIAAVTIRAKGVDGLLDAFEARAGELFDPL